MTAKKAAKKKAKKKATKPRPKTVLIGRGLPDPSKTGKRFFCVAPVYAQQMTKPFMLLGDGPIHKKGSFLLKRGDRVWVETREEFMQSHTMVDETIPQAPYAGTENMPLMDCDDIFAWYRFEEGRWVRGDRFTTVDWLIAIAAIIAILFAGTALVRALPDAYVWWRTIIG